MKAWIALLVAGAILALPATASADAVGAKRGNSSTTALGVRASLNPMVTWAQPSTSSFIYDHIQVNGPGGAYFKLGYLKPGPAGFSGPDCGGSTGNVRRIYAEWFTGSGFAQCNWGQEISNGEVHEYIIDRCGSLSDPDTWWCAWIDGFKLGFSHDLLFSNASLTNLKAANQTDLNTASGYTTTTTYGGQQRFSWTIGENLTGAWTGFSNSQTCRENLSDAFVIGAIPSSAPFSFDITSSSAGTTGTFCP